MVQTALILAYHEEHVPSSRKPIALTRLYGVSLIKRILFTLREVGIRKFIVVLGYQGSAIKREIEKDSSLTGSIEWIDNPHWDRGDGYAVSLAVPFLQEPFLVIPCNLIFRAPLVERLLDRARSDRPCHLLVDTRVHQRSMISHVARVQIQNGLLRAIGEDVEPFNALSTGIYRLTPAFFPVLHANIRQGKDQLSDTVQTLADSGAVGAIDVGDASWQPIRSPRDRRCAEKLLLGGLGKPTDGPIARAFNRRVSIFLSSYLARTPIKPDHLTFITLVVGLTGSWYATYGTYRDFLIGAILFKMASILDGCDGEIARLKYMVSSYGQWLDTISDNVICIAALVGITIGIHRGEYSPIYRLSSYGAMVFGLLSFLMLYLYLLRKGKDGVFYAVDYAFKYKQDPLHRLFRRLSLFGRRDVIATVALALAVLGLTPLMMIYLALLTLGMFIFSVQANLVKREAQINRS